MQIDVLESRFVNIIACRPYEHLKSVFNKYKQTYAMSMTEVINDEMSGELKTGLLTIGE